MTGFLATVLLDREDDTVEDTLDLVVGLEAGGLLAAEIEVFAAEATVDRDDDPIAVLGCAISRRFVGAFSVGFCCSTSSKFSTFLLAVGAFNSYENKILIK